MAEAFGVLSAAAGFLDVTFRASSGLHNLIIEYRNAPELILALSNEVSEARVVVERVRDAQQTVERLSDSQHDAVFLDNLKDQLAKARAIIADIECLANILSTGTSPGERFRWLRKKKDAARLKNRLQEATRRVNDLLIAQNPSLSGRIKLELHTVHVGMQKVHAEAQAAANRAEDNFRATSRQLVANQSAVAQTQAAIHSEMHFVRGAMGIHNDQLSAIHDTLTAGSQALDRIDEDGVQRFEANQTMMAAILTELSLRNDASAMAATRRSGSRVQPVPYLQDPTYAVFFSMRSRGSHCQDGCLCLCHQPGGSDFSIRFPAMLRAAVGSLFLAYTGYPSASSRCNVGSCARGKYLRLQVSYAFPAWVLAYVVQALVEVSTSGTLTFALAARRRMGYTGILFEADWGNETTLARAIQHARGSIQDVYYSDGRSALRMAVNALAVPSWSARAAELLLQNGADPDQEDDYGISPRLAAADALLTKGGPPAYRRQMVELFSLSPSGDELDLTYYHKITLGLLPISLTSALRDPLVEQLNSKDRFGCTPLMYAARRGDAAGVQALIDAGAEVNEMDTWHRTALHFTMRSESGEMLSCLNALLLAGADVNAKPRGGYTCLHTAAERDNVAICRRLVEAGADIEPRSVVAGLTPMTEAARFSAVNAVRWLCEAGASLEFTDKEGWTPLFFAAAYGTVETFALLLRLGANIAHVDKNGWTLLHVVAHSVSLEAMRSLAAVDVRGLDASTQNRERKTAEDCLFLRHPASKARTEAFAHLVRVWCERACDAIDGDTSEEGECFHDAAEYQ